MTTLNKTTLINSHLEDYIEMLKTHLEVECEKSNRYHREGPGRSVDRAAIADRRIENLRALLVSLGELPKSAL